MRRENFNKSGKSQGIEWRVCTFDSYGDFIKHVSDESIPRDSTGIQEDDDSRGHQGVGSFRFFRAWEPAIHAAKTGWKHGRDQMVKGLDASALLAGCAPLRIAGYDVAGSYPCVPLAAAGEPLCMVNEGLDQSRTTPIIRIMISLSALADVKATTIINRGAAILSWIDKLESAGARCELTAIRSNYDNGTKRKWTFSFPLKRAEESLSLDQCAFALLCPDMLRRLGFALQEQEACSGWKMFDSYGYSQDYIPPSLEIPHSVYFGCLSGNNADEWNTPGKAVAYVERAIRDALRHDGDDSLIDGLIPQSQ